MASELRLDPEPEVDEGRERERVTIEQGASSLRDVLCLRVLDFEGGVPSEGFDVDGPDTNTMAQFNMSESPRMRLT